MMVMFFILFVIYTFFPITLGILSVAFLKKKRIVVFALVVLLTIAVELGCLFYFQHNPITEYNQEEISTELATAIINEAREKGYTVDKHGEFELGKYVFIVKYRLYRHAGTNDLGSLQILALPFGENRKNIYFDNPVSFFNQ